MFPQSWDVTLVSRGKTIALESAQPDYGTVGTPPEGLDLEAVYVGLGSEADVRGRDVAGKAVVVFSMLGAPNEGAVRRANEKALARYSKSTCCRGTRDIRRTLLAPAGRPSPSDMKMASQRGKP